MKPEMGPSRVEERDEISQTIEDAVMKFTSEGDTKSAIEYLRAHRNDVTEFCLQTFESYQSGDKTGIAQLARVIEELL